MGSDISIEENEVINRIFQFTLPCGERQEVYLNLLYYIKYFNSRSRVGSDSLIFFIQSIYTYFNSRSRVGSDCTLVRIFTMIPIFLTYIINLK